MTRKSYKEKTAKEGIENLKSLLDYYKEYPNATVGIERDYYHLESIINAYKDIQLRKSLGASTIADGLLLSIMYYSFRVYQ